MTDQPLPEIPQLTEFTDQLITIWFNADEGMVEFDIGDVDEWTAESMIRQVADDIYGNLPAPQNRRDRAEDEDAGC